jgi:hypothetical protein
VNYPEKVPVDGIIDRDAASALGVDADAVLEAELARIQRPEVVERCRRRQDEKRAALVTGDTTAAR